MQRKKKNKIFSLLVLMAMLVTLLPYTAFAGVPMEAYPISNQKIKEVTYYDKNPDPTAPEEYENYPAVTVLYDDPDNHNNTEIFALKEVANAEESKDEYGNPGYKINGKWYKVVAMWTVNPDEDIIDKGNGEKCVSVPLYVVSGGKPQEGENINIAVCDWDYTKPDAQEGDLKGGFTEPVEITVPKEGESVTVKKDSLEEITSVTIDRKSFVYNGEIQHANVTEVKAGDKVLSASEYTVKYSQKSSKFAGKYTITVTGTGNYKGTKEAVYEIEPAPVTDATLSEVLYVYNREVQKPTLTSVKSNNTVLTTNDYDAVYSNAKSKNKGEYSVTVTGRVNYTGTVEAIYHIDPAVVANATLGEKIFTYNQKIQKSKVKEVKSENGLVLTSDEYTVTYDTPKSTDVGSYKLTVSGKGNFTGKVEKSYKINKAEITTVKLNKTEYTYNGKVHKSSVKSVKAGDLVLTKDDYSAKWSNKKSTDAGNYRITVTGKGNYTGSLDAYYRIKPAKISKVTVDKVKYTYNKKAQRPLVTKVKAGDFTLEKKDYSVNYSKKNSKDVGSYSLLVESKNPNFSGHEGTTYKINPLGTSITKLAAGSKSITATWKKQTTKMSQTTITGYKIQASLTKDFKSVASEAKVKGAAKTSGKLTGLKANKKYYVRIRTYKTIGKSTYFSGWKVYKKTVKVKK